MWVAILFILHFSKQKWQNYTLNVFFIDNEKGIPNFKFTPLDYGYSGVYLQKYKVTGNITLLIALSFCLKVGMSKMIEIDNDLWPLLPIFKHFIIKLNFAMTKYTKCLVTD